MENATQSHVVVPPSALHTSLPKIKSTAPTNRKRIFLYVLIGFAVLIVLGAGAVFASTKGYIALPFKLPFITSSVIEEYQEKNLSQALDSLLAINSGRYQYDLVIANEPKEAGIQPLDFNLLQPDENTNQNGNSYLPFTLEGSSSGDWLASIFPKDSTLTLLLTGLFNKSGNANAATNADVTKNPALGFLLPGLGNTTGSSDTAPNSEMELSGSYSGNDLSVEAGLQFKVVDQVPYVKVTKLPTIPGVDLSASYQQVVNKWIKIEQTSFTDTYFPYFQLGSTILQGNGIPSLDQTASQQIMRDLLRLALEHRFIVIKEKLVNEKINDVEQRHWRMWFDATKTAETYQAFVAYLNEKYPDLKISIDQETTTYLSSEKFRQFTDQLKNNATIDLWLSTKDWLPTKLSLSYKIALDSQNENLIDRQIRLTGTASLKDANQPMTVKAPAETETILFDDAVCAISGISAEDCQAAVLATKQQKQISNLRTALYLYRNKKDAYPETLSAVAPVIEESYNECLNKDTSTNTNGNTNNINSINSSLSSNSFECVGYNYINSNLTLTDVYTDKPYPYAVKKDSYTLVYQMRAIESLPDYGSIIDYIDGTNTATPDSSSLEAAAQKEKDAADKIADDDTDALTNADEELYGTDPAKDDTDADGYKDGEEVNNGYNPNGEGKLIIVPSAAASSPKTRDNARLAHLRTFQSALELYINDTGDTPFAEGEKNWLTLKEKLKPYLAAGLSPTSQLGCTVKASSGDPFANTSYQDCFIYCDNGTNYLLASFSEGTANLTSDVDTALKSYDTASECITNAGPLTSKPSFTCTDPILCLGQP